MELLTDNTLILYGLALLSGYLLGAISFARIISRLFSRSGKPEKIERDIPDTDITLESDAVTATTVNLELGPRLGCFTSILDMLKVSVPTWLFLHFWPDTYAFLVVAIAGMFGHIYTIYYRFRGGRGMSPLMGGLLIIDWPGLLISMVSSFVLGFLTGSVLVIRWSWMLVLIAWFAFFRDAWHVAYMVIANFLFFFSMRKELATGIKIGRNRKSTQEEVSEFMLMGKRFGRFFDQYGLPALLKKALKGEAIRK